MAVFLIVFSRSLMPKTCSGFGYGKDKLPEGGSKSFGFSEGGKLHQGLGAKPEHGSGGKILLPEGKDHGADFPPKGRFMVESTESVYN
jgi:hypothetical protein